MKYEEYPQELKNKLSDFQPKIKYKKSKYMMATKAYHKLGDISSNAPNLCSVSGENGEFYVGSWVTGYGFFHVNFPKETTRELTQKEIEHYNTQYIGY